MDKSQQLAIFQAQTVNLREMGRAWVQAKRSVNQSLAKSDLPAAKIHTKLLALIYSAWSESSLLKVIHTPYGFELDEIRQIKVVWRSNGITAAWKKTITLALRKVRTRGGNYVPNVSLRLERLVNQYIEAPSQLRNKIAHGQWEIALNSKNSASDAELTAKLADLDCVKIDILREGCIGLCKIVESLIESPDGAFHRDYWQTLQEVQDHLTETSKHSLAEKVARLRVKKSLAKLDKN